MTVRNTVGEDTFCEEVTIHLRTVSTVEFLSDLGITLYPNPVTDGEMFLHNKNGVVGKIYFTDVSGRQIQQFILSGGSREVLNVAGFSPGMYVMEIHTEQGIAVEKVVVE